MKRQQLDRILLYASIACFFFTSFSILILPPKLSLTHQRLFGAVAGGVFWFSLLAGVALLVLTNGERHLRGAASGARHSSARVEKQKPRTQKARPPRAAGRYRLW